MDTRLPLTDKEHAQAIADGQFDAQITADAGKEATASLTEKQKLVEIARLQQLQENRYSRAADISEIAQAERDERARKAAEAARKNVGVPDGGGRRRRNSKSKKGNSWLAHVKATMKDKKNNGKAYKQILKIAKKTYKKSQSQSGGKGRKGKTGGSTMKNYQNGGSGGKMDGVAKYATPV